MLYLYITAERCLVRLGAAAGGSVPSLKGALLFRV